MEQKITMAWLIALHGLVLLEIILTGFLLWLFFYLCEHHKPLQRKLGGYIKLLEDYTGKLREAEHSLKMACQVHGQITYKWHTGATIIVTILEKLGTIFPKSVCE